MIAAERMTPEREVLWTAADAAAATGGHATRAWAASGVTLDSRAVTPGDLFVAVRGERTDGHRFVADALRRGAAAAVVDRLPEDVAPDAPLLRVADTAAALDGLAAAGRARGRARVIAVTGSVGKTGVKDALAHVLGAQGPTHAAAKSYNNRWGVPLTLAQLPPRAHHAVLELGMNAPGEIAGLSRLVRPDVVVITAIAPAHIEALGSEAAIAEEKASIATGAGAGATAVVPRDTPHAATLAARAREHGLARVISFGRDPNATVRLVEAQTGAGGSTVTAALGERHLTFRVGVPGDHWVTNALAVLAAVAAAGADPGAAAASLGELTPPPGRGRVHTIAVPGGDATLIDDSYNANPASMRAALALLGRHTPGDRGRRVAVLADMLELGEHSEPEHAGLAEPVRESGAELVFTAGAAMRALADALPAGVHAGHAAAADALAATVGAALRPGDVVLVKGSAGARAGALAEALRTSDAGEGA